MLIGRETERARIDRMLADARGGRSGALVLRGEAGIGKSALLDYAASAAGDARVARALGVETESEFAYSGLHELVRPLLAHLDALPGVQAEALRGALALAPAAGAGRLYVGAATLSLLAAAAEDGPLLCLVDDAQWLDAASAAALVFAARRLEAEGVVMLFAARDRFAARGVPELALTGLEDEQAARLLEERAHGVSPAVAAALSASTRGNPLALRELSARLRPSQLAGTEPLPHVLPVGPDLESVYAHTAEELSAEARRALVIAATADTRAMRVITRAEGAGRSGLEECESSGLLHIDAEGVTFTHPLVRSAVYHRATPGERRDAHRALAEALAGDPRYEERSAWHAAAAAVQPDEGVAARLEEAAVAAAERRAHLAAAAAFERAARLTPEAAAVARRLQLAARSARLAGQVERALALLDEAGRLAADPVVAADVVQLRAVAAPGGRGSDVDALVAAAAAVEPHDRLRAATLLALVAERSAGAVEVARRALELASGDPAVELRARLVLARALLDGGHDVEAHDLLAACRAALAAHRELRSDPELILTAVETLAAVGGADDPLSRELLEDVIAAARAHAVVVLPGALLLSAWRHLESGGWTDAAVELAEAARLAGELGHERERSDAVAGFAILAALRGHSAEAANLAAEVGDVAAADHVRALVELAAGRIAAAIPHLEAAAAGAVRPFRGVPGPAVELVEAYLRVARDDEAAAAAAAAPAAQAALARALLGDEAAFVEALGAAAEIPFVAARLRLARGEALRRSGARREARDELRTALAVFERLGAEPWSERARRELRASGASLRRREPDTLDELTPQELQIARLIAGGASQKEVAAELYLSPKTIEYHLGKVYRKLGISSGRQLRHRLDERKLLEAS